MNFKIRSKLFWIKGIIIFRRFKLYNYLILDNNVSPKCSLKFDSLIDERNPHFRQRTYTP